VSGRERALATGLFANQTHNQRRGSALPIVERDWLTWTDRRTTLNAAIDRHVKHVDVDVVRRVPP